MSSSDRHGRLGLIAALVTALTAVVGTMIGVLQWLEIEIVEFSADASLVKQGERISLSWQVQNAGTVRIETTRGEPIGEVGDMGQRSHFPDRTTVYELIAERFIFSRSASWEVIVEPSSDALGRPLEVTTRTVTFTGVEDYEFIQANAFANRGLQSIRAAPEGTYCADAVVALHPRGSYRSVVSFLTTADPGDIRRCNGVPIEISFVHPVQEVAVRFYGADAPYRLIALDNNGYVVEQTTSNASPYNYQRDYEARVRSDSRDIARLRFGHTAALTMIRDIEFVR